MRIRLPLRTRLKVSVARLIYRFYPRACWPRLGLWAMGLMSLWAALKGE